MILISSFAPGFCNLTTNGPRSSDLVSQRISLFFWKILRQVENFYLTKSSLVYKLQSSLKLLAYVNGLSIILTIYCLLFSIYCSFLLFTVHFSLFTFYSLLFTVHSLFTVHFSLFTVYSLLFTVHCLLFTVYCSLFTFHCSLFTFHFLLFLLFTFYCSLFTVHFLPFTLFSSLTTSPSFNEMIRSRYCITFSSWVANIKVVSNSLFNFFMV